MSVGKSHQLLTDIVEDHALLLTALRSAVPECQQECAADKRKIAIFEDAEQKRDQRLRCVQHRTLERKKNPLSGRSAEQDSEQRVSEFMAMAPAEKDVAYTELEQKFTQLSNHLEFSKEAYARLLQDARVENIRLLSLCDFQKAPGGEGGGKAVCLPSLPAAAPPAVGTSSAIVRRKPSRQGERIFALLGVNMSAQECVHRYDNDSTLCSVVRGNVWGDHKCRLCNAVFESPLQGALMSREAVLCANTVQ